MVTLSDTVSRPKISVYSFIQSESLTGQLIEALSGDHYTTDCFHSLDRFFIAVEQNFPSIDCLVIEQSTSLAPTISRLHHSAILLPAVILTEQADLLTERSPDRESSGVYYHTAETYVEIHKLDALSHSVENAIARFLRLSPQCRLPLSNALELETSFSSSSKFQQTLSAQQKRLSEKLKERLGYLGLFYKRDAQMFFRNLSAEDQAQFLEDLRNDYRDIILVYFQEKSDVNQRIDAFVNKVFFSDLSVSQVLEIHMEFMDRLAKKLRLEGRSEEILLDYRLTLIDTIAHLCEMYRRSIPRQL